jgi:hypothetical protein
VEIFGWNFSAKLYSAPDLLVLSSGEYVTATHAVQESSGKIPMAVILGKNVRGERTEKRGGTIAPPPSCSPGFSLKRAWGNVR